MSIDDVQLDVLDSGHEPDRRRRAAAVGLAVVLVLTLLVGWYADHRSRQGEYAAVSRCATESASAYRVSTVRLSAMGEYVRPSLVMATEPTARGLYGMVAHEAAGVDNTLAEVRDRCAAIDVRPWHPKQREALTAQLAVQDVELSHLALVATEGAAYYQEVPRLDQLRSAAAGTLAAARPAQPW